MSRQMWLVSVLLLGAVAGCTTGEQSPRPAAPSATGTAAPESVAPSITRQVPPEQRQHLGTIPADRLCGLVSSEELGKLAFPVDNGQSRELGLNSPVRGCTFPARSGDLAILIGVLPENYAQLGTEQVSLGSVLGTKTLHVNDCTVLAPVADATLQVTVRKPESESDQCVAAEGIAQYVLAGLAP